MRASAWAKIVKECFGFPWPLITAPRHQIQVLSPSKMKEPDEIQEGRSSVAAILARILKSLGLWAYCTTLFLGDLGAFACCIEFKSRCFKLFKLFKPRSNAPVGCWGLHRASSRMGNLGEYGKQGATLPPRALGSHGGRSAGGPGGLWRCDDLGREPTASCAAQPDAPRGLDPGAAGHGQDLHRVQAVACMFEHLWGKSQGICGVHCVLWGSTGSYV